MAYEAVIQDLIRARNGYLHTADAVAKGIARVSLGAYVEKHALERVSYGIYITPETMTDDLYLLQSRNTAHATPLISFDRSQLGVEILLADLQLAL